MSMQMRALGLFWLFYFVDFFVPACSFSSSTMRMLGSYANTRTSFLGVSTQRSSNFRRNHRPVWPGNTGRIGGGPHTIVSSLFGGGSTSKKILFICGDYMEDYEVTVPFHTLSSYGYTVHTVSPGKTADDTCRTAIHDFEGDQTYSEKPGHLFELNSYFALTSAVNYDALVIPGGRAPEHLALDSTVLALVQGFVQAGKPVASICHGQQILARADVLRGKRITGYPTLAPACKAAGAEWINPEPIDLAITHMGSHSAAAAAVATGAGGARDKEEDRHREEKTGLAAVTDAVGEAVARAVDSLNGEVSGSDPSVRGHYAAASQGTLVTAAAWPGHPEFLKQLVHVLGGKVEGAEGKKVLMLCGDYMEDHQAMVPFQALQSYGFAVHAVCPGKQAGDTCRTAVHDFGGDQTYSEKPGHNFELNEDFDKAAQGHDYDALVIPGGRAAEYLALNESVLGLVQRYVRAGKPVGAIGHGPQILAAADVLKGRRCTSSIFVAADCEAAGAVWTRAEEPDAVVTDDKLITGAIRSDLPDFIRQLVAAMGATVHV